ncbi:MAG: hypothetical protein HRT36_04480 [Alphaproteobacteria bacterium]|nr:hypothetical protein [Alphaproteobacteria bacterium]
MARDRFSLEEDKTLDVVNDVRELASARLMPIVPDERPISDVSVLQELWCGTDT